MKEILVLGSNFAGATAAIQLSRKLKKEDVNITVISPSEDFIYIPSLIWVPFGKRRIDEITFKITKVFARKKINFIKDKAVKVDPEVQIVETETSGDFVYDYLVIATGAGLNFDSIKGFSRKEAFTSCIVTPAMALEAYEGYKKLIEDPGPVVIGATQGASCMGASYEYLFNLDRQLRKDGLRKKVPITWVTPEPYLGHFGIGGIRGGEKMLKAFMKLYGIDYRVNTGVKEFQKDRLILDSGEVLKYKYAMFMPLFVGANVSNNPPGLGDEKGFIPCDDSYKHLHYDNIYAAGLSVKVIAPFKPEGPAFGVPKTGYPTDMQGKIVAFNIAEKIKGTNKIHQKAFGKIPAVCVMDAGDKEVWIFANNLFKPRAIEVMIPNVFWNFMKRFLEKYMLIKNRRGWTFLP